MDHKNILVFPCGSEVGLEIIQSLKDISFLTVYGGSSVDDHGKYAYSNYIGDLPFISQPNFLDILNATLEKYQIDYLFPAMDEVIEYLSTHREKINTTLLIPSKKTVHICRNKYRTYVELQQFDFVPLFYENPELVTSYPVIIKPEEGYGAKGFFIVNSKEDLVYKIENSSTKNVICEYLPGTEYTVDCFTNRHGELLYCQTRSRNRIRNGISVNSTTCPDNPEIYKIAKIISNYLKMRGAWFFQLKENKEGKYRLMEIATRIAGTMCVERAKGVNMPLLTILDFMEIDLEILQNNYNVETDRALYNAYELNIDYDTVYIDFDDTIICKDKINQTAMAFLYQCINQHKQIILITKHESNIYATLERNHIPTNLFDKIIHINKNQRKADYIDCKQSIFIDDSFAERRDVAKTKQIATFGVDMIECLINHRG